MNFSLKLISVSTRWDFLSLQTVILIPSSVQFVLTGIYNRVSKASSTRVERREM